EEFTRVLTTGMRDDGLAVRPPMPIFRFMDGDEAAALLAYLRSVPPTFRRIPGPPRAAVDLTAAPEKIFATLACSICHGEGAPHRALLKQLADKPAAEIAAAIRHPEQMRPHSQMPSYASVLDDGAAVRLAIWIKSTGATRRP
ncbi:MAG: cytochrome c, partial [Deltaproteobacteria bacterium]|nr:cytochrome c [Deltaproteobacteria bacterium]